MYVLARDQLQLRNASMIHKSFDLPRAIDDEEMETR